MQTNSSSTPINKPNGSLGRPNKRGYKKYIIGIIVIVLVIVFFILHSASGSTSIIQTAPVTVGNVVEIVNVTGQVLPVDKADLSFEKSGTISAINVAVGDTVKAGDAIATLDSATDQASLATQQAKLDDLTRSLRPVEYAADQSQVSAAQVALANAEADAENASRQAYVSIQSAVNNYTDSFFTNPQSVNPTINVTVQSQQNQIAINNERLEVSSILAAWKADIATSTMSAASATTLLASADGYLTTIKSFMSDLSTIINSLSSGNSSLSANVIAADVATMNSAMAGENSAETAVTAAQTELTNASSSLGSAQSQFALDQAGSSQDAINAQSAQVDVAKAELAQDTINSPIDGIITQVVPNVGEFVPAGQVEFSVINDGIYKIEAYVAEADIAKVAINDMASVTLDAYGSNVNFPAHVVAIDPAETVLQGVPTYKVTLYFNANDPRIRSGMTANTYILTHEVDNVIEIPYRAVINNASGDITGSTASTTVRVVNADGKTYDTVPVTIGLKGSDGTAQIISGLSVGQTVVVDLKQ
jgi:RND family efflux transporter MFP subunit